MRFLQRIVLFLSWTYCAAQDCKNPPPRRVTEILVSNVDGEVFKEGSTATYKCRPGYRTLGSITMTCRNGDWVESVRGKTCQKKPCGHPGDIQFGSFELTREKDFVYGSRVVYKCDEGYKMVSQTDFRDCEADGWSNDVPFCDVIKCLPVTAPKNGMIILSGNLDSDQEFHFGQVVQFKCNSNYKLEGQKEIFCSTDGNWNEPEPTCVEIYCERPKLENGIFVTATSIFKENERLQYSCNPGYYYKERGDAICTESGWNPHPSCTEILCNRPSLANGVFRPDKDKYRADEEIELQCNQGFQAPPEGKKAKCTNSGWIPSPRCSFRPCDRPEIENGEMYKNYDLYWDLTRTQYPAQIGVTKYYRCNHHFRSAHRTDYSGWTTIECTENGWSPTPKCLRWCQVPHIQNSYNSNYGRGFNEGAQVSITCSRGFSLESGENTITCTKNGWSPAPQCKKNVNCRKTYVLNGRFSETKEYYNLNAKTRYQCSEGYSTPEGRESGELICLRNGWSVSPSCIKTCKRPEFRNARYEGNETLFQLNSKLEYECLDGYIRGEGRSTTDSIVCGEDGWSHIPECQEKECYIPDLKSNVRVVQGKDKFKVGDVLSFACHSTQKRIGPESIQCYHFGWSPDPPTCKEAAQSCGPPPEVVNGKANANTEKGTYRHGEVVDFECDAKFIMEGPKRIECSDGKWTSFPTCIEVEKTCGDPPELEQGDLKSSHPPPYHHGDSVEYGCKEPFAMVGKKTVTCIQGNWTAHPQCIGTKQLKKCSGPKQPSNGKITSLKKRDYKHNDFLTYICDANFEAEGSTKIQCINGNWQHLPNCLRKERRKTCSPPPQIPQALVVSTSVSFLNGETFAVKCKDNYLLQGPKEIKCENGAWKSVPRCVEKKPCSQPPSVKNAAFNVSRNSRRAVDYLAPKTYASDTVLKYTCMDGFIMNGTAEITCTMGKWSPPPKCVGRPCGKPPLIFNGATAEVTVDVYQSGEEVTYKCSEGFGINGSPSITCEGGKWSEKPECIDRRCNTPPRFIKAEITEGKKPIYMEGDELLYKCLDGFESEGSTLVTCSGTTWKGDPKCKDHSCGSPPSVQYAVIVGNEKARYKPGETVRYKCLGDLKMFGVTDIVCKNKTWTKRPECKEEGGKCGPPPPINNGDITSFTFAEYPSGAQVEYKCQNLYKLEGSKVVRCENGQWSNPPSCLDACTASQEDMMRNNIKLRWENHKKLYSETGDIIEFACKNGYTRAQGSPPFRAQCIQGKLTYPNCVKQY